MVQQETKWCRDVKIWVRVHCYEELFLDDSSVTIKLRMFEVPIEKSTEIFYDNEALYKNASTPESRLRKKHHRIIISHEQAGGGHLCMQDGKGRY